MKTICPVCGYVYDDAKEKIPFADLPDSWHCPLCGAAKSDFRPEEAKSTPVRTNAPILDADLKEFSAGQLASLCSNLARGCEKQYNSEAASLFHELSDYFTLAVKPVHDATVERLAAILLSDVENYPAVRATADQAGDRGAARVCVWGEKVTRMLSSLVNRYLKEGEQLLEGTHIWVCTVCGFVYIGNEAPTQCPVCKVPAWKFEKIEGRENA